MAAALFTAPGLKAGSLDLVANPIQSVRDDLQNHGIAIGLEWDADVFANVRGGKEQGIITNGLLRLGLDFDLQKLTEQSFFDDSRIHLEGYYPYGTDISSYVRDLAGVNDNAAYNSPRLYELWIQKGFKIGFLAIGPKFLMRNKPLFSVKFSTTARHDPMTCSLPVLLLLLLLTTSLCRAQQPPSIELPPSYTVEVLSPAVSQNGSAVSVSGWVRMSNPWAGTTWGHLEVSLLDSKGNLIKKIPTDYFPRPIARLQHSANQPEAFFAINIDAGSQSVALVRIAYQDGSISHLAP